MSLQTFLEWVTQGSIVLLAIMVLVQYARWRDRVSLDIVLVFGTLAFVSVLQRSVRLANIEAGWIPPFGISVLLAHPYLLLRVVSHFRPVSTGVMRVALAGLLVSLTVVWVSMWPFHTAPMATVGFAYFIWLLGYVAFAFRQGAKNAGGVTHWRMLHASWGAALLALVVVLAVLIGLVPDAGNSVAAFIPLSAIGAALNYYIAFSPPAWLRRVWQSAELYGQLAEASSRVTTSDEPELLGRMCVFVMCAVGATGAAVAFRQKQGDQLVVHFSRWGYLEPGRIVPEGRLLAAWRADKASHIADFEWVGRGGAPGSVYAVPIPSKVAAPGMLFAVLPKGALFVADDLALLRICCREAAIQLDITRMLAEQQALIGELELKGAQLTAVNEELEAFSYSVSHDLRAPLRHISGFTDLLERSPGAELEPGRKRFLKLISESAVKMGDLIDSLLVFSRMGRAEMLHSRVDLNAIVRAAMREVIQGDPARQVSWKIDQLPEVPGDSKMLQLVFTNLLSNAFKYSRTREHASIEVGSTDGTPGEVVVFIRDNGVGFDMAYADRLFGVFQRLHRAEEFEGTGIGLANVQRIVLRHGGRVWAEAEPEKGATFFVALPTERQKLEASAV